MKSENTKDLFLKALKDSKGIISYACDSVGISRQTYYRWIKEDAEFSQNCDDITDMVIDLVESKLLSNINNGDVTSTIFFLKTKGKKRGYIERIQTEDLTDREPIEVSIVLPKERVNEDKSND